MIARKYQHIVFAFFMSLLMSSLMSFVISIANVGFVENLFFIWLRAWALAFTIAFPAIIVVAPIVRRLVNIALKADTGDN